MTRMGFTQEEAIDSIHSEMSRKYGGATYQAFVDLLVRMEALLTLHPLNEKKKLSADGHHRGLVIA